MYEKGKNGSKLMKCTRREMNERIEIEMNEEL